MKRIITLFLVTIFVFLLIGMNNSRAYAAAIPIKDSDLSLRIYDSKNIDISSNEGAISIGDTVKIVPQISSSAGAGEVIYRYNYRYTSQDGVSKGYNIIQTQDASIDFSEFTKAGKYEFVIYAKRPDQAEFARFELGTDFVISALPSDASEDVKSDVSEDVKPIKDSDLSLRIYDSKNIDISSNEGAISIGDTVKIVPQISSSAGAGEVIYRYNYRYTSQDGVSKGYNIIQTQDASIDFSEFTKAGKYEFVIYAKRPDQAEFARFELGTDFVISALPSDVSEDVKSDVSEDVKPIKDSDLSLRIYDSKNIDISSNEGAISIGDTVKIVPKISSSAGAGEVIYRYNYRYTSQDGVSKGYNIIQTQDASIDFSEFTKAGKYEFVIYAKRPDQAEFARFELGMRFVVKNSEVYLYSLGINIGGLRIYTSHTTSSAIKGYIPWGKRVQYHEGTDKIVKGTTWIKITYGKKTGWVEKQNMWDKQPGSRGFVIPVDGEINNFNSDDGSHKDYGAIDINGKWGARIRAAKSGIVKTGGKECYYNKKTEKYYEYKSKELVPLKDEYPAGLYIIIDHEDGTYSYYEHLSSISVRNGQRVTQGIVIGYMGNTGRCISNWEEICTPENERAAHLHFAIKSGNNFSGTSKDLRKYFDINIKKKKNVEYGDKWN